MKRPLKNSLTSRRGTRSVKMLTNFPGLGLLQQSIDQFDVNHLS